MAILKLNSLICSEYFILYLFSILHQMVTLTTTYTNGISIEWWIGLSRYVSTLATEAITVMTFIIKMPTTNLLITLLSSNVQYMPMPAPHKITFNFATRIKLFVDEYKRFFQRNSRLLAIAKIFVAFTHLITPKKKKTFTKCHLCCGSVREVWIWYFFALDDDLVREILFSFYFVLVCEWKVNK